MTPTPTPTDLAALDLGPLVPSLFGHAAFQQLHAGCELGLFELLHRRSPLSAALIAEELALPDRSVQMLLLGTTALGFTEIGADGIGADGYRLGPILSAVLAAGCWPVLADIVEFQASVAYIPAATYVESLRSGRNEGLRSVPGDGADLYGRLGADPERERLFYRGMSAWSRLSNPVLRDGVDLSGVSSVLDVGGGDGANAIVLAQAHPELRLTVLDRASALDVARTRIAEHGLADRVGVAALDLFDDPWPAGHDAVLLAHQMVIWTPEQNRRLLARARAALPDGGRLLIFNAFADDDGRGPLYAALDNVYFATLPATGSVLYPWSTYEGWLADTGFAVRRRVQSHSWTPHGVIDARKV